MNVRTVILIFVAFMGIGVNTAMSADTISVTNPDKYFWSHGTCSCKASEDCRPEIKAKLKECSEKEAYKNAQQLCPEGSGYALKKGEFEHDSCSVISIVCDTASAKFYCEW